MADRVLEKNMIPSYLRDKGLLVVDNSFRNVSEPFTFIGNYTGEVLLQPTEKIWIKAIAIYPVTGNSAIIRVKRSTDDKTILPLSVTQQNKGGVSSSFNMPIEAGESVYVDIENASGDENFIGISYLPDKVF